jgi:general secretion pathway protein H
MKQLVMAGLGPAIYAAPIGPRPDGARSAWEDGRVKPGHDEEGRRRDVSFGAGQPPGRWSTRNDMGRGPVSRHRQGGFTLIEMIVVLAVLGLALSLVLLHGGAGSPALEFDSAVREVAGTLRLARSRAIADDRPVTVVIAPQSFQLDGGAAIVLPPMLSMTGNGLIRFLPDGGSSGGQITLHMAERAMTIDVDWLTGRVHLLSHG